ncbi:MAG: TRAP transporter substrate-binding protein DctP [Deltaproteobacteria bacterium]|nr:TRAP transporter substrate-binding protein DctP [Deltaproteobacteria bacterium]
MLASKKAGICMVIIFAVALGLGLSGQALAAEKVTVWKTATLAPKGLGWAQQWENLVSPWVKESTDDTVRFKIFWGGVMGNDHEYIQKMKIGQLQGAGLTGHGANLACPEFAVLGLPFLFNNFAEVDYIRQVMFNSFQYYFEQNGFRLLLWIDADFDQIYSSKWKFDRLDDFKKSKFQTWYGPLESNMLKALGANPVAIQPTEANSAYRSGIIDANIGPAIYQVGSQMYTSCKYINPLKTRYAPAIIAVKLNAWQALSDEYQDRLEDDREDVTERFCIGVRKDNEKSIEGMLKYGLEMVTVSAENKAAIQKAASRIYKDMSGKLYPPDLLEEVQRYLASYRSGKPIKPSMVRAPRKKAVTAQAKPAAPVVAAASAEEIEKAYKEQQENLRRQAEEKKKAPVVADEEDKDAGKKRESAWEERRRRIREVQTKLKALGFYNSKVDGIFGPLTMKGINEYQKSKGLRQTGTVDPPLLKSMGVK